MKIVTPDNFEAAKEAGAASVSVGGAIHLIQQNALEWLAHPLVYMLLTLLIPFIFRWGNAQMKFYFDKKRKASGLDTTEGTESKDPNKE